MDPTTQGRIRLLASVILRSKNYKFLAIADTPQQEISYSDLSTEQKNELGDFFNEMWKCGFVLYDFNFSMNSDSRLLLTDFEHYDFVFTRPCLVGTSFYTQIKSIKEKIPQDFIQYIPNSTIKADILGV